MKYRYSLLVLFLIMAGQVYSQLNNSVINTSGCGLNFIHKSIKITNRTAPVEVPGNSMPVTFSISELPSSCFQVEAAYLWWIVSYYDGSPANPTASVVNPASQLLTVPALMTGQKEPKCWGEIGTRGFRADVTTAITGNGNYNISVTTPQKETDGLTLVVIYRDLKAAYQGHFIINDGLLTANSGNLSQTIDNFTACDSSTNAKALLIASDLQRNLGNPPQLEFVMNGITYNMSRDFWNSEVVNTSVGKFQTTSDFGVHGGPDCYSWIMMGLYFQTTTCLECPVRLQVIASASDYDICKGNSVTLNSEGGAVYSWSSIPAGFTSNQKSPTVTPNKTTKYIVEGRSSDGCLTGKDTVTVKVLESPVVNAGPDHQICLGNSVTIGQDPTGGTPPYQIIWTPTTGLSAIDVATPVASPKVTTSYYMTVIDNKGCLKRDTVLVTVFPVPVADAGGDQTICMGESAGIGNYATGGTEPYYYSWSPGTGLSSDNQPLVVASPAVTTVYSLTVSDANGCVSHDTVLVEVLPLPKPLITPSGPAVICSCDSVILDAGGPYNDYLWSSGQTSRRITVNTTGVYTVSVTDSNGCRNTSQPFSVTVINPTALISLADNGPEASPGDTIYIPLMINQSDSLDFCKDFNYTAVIQMNRSLLVPIFDTPKGIITGNTRTITLNGRRQTGNNILKTLSFAVTLGDTTQTRISLNSFDWIDCPFGVSFRDGIFKLSGLCNSGGGPRLNKQGTVTGLESFWPNPVSNNINIKYTLAADEYCRILITNIYGSVTRILTDGTGTKGSKDIHAEISDIPDGCYFLVMQTVEGISKIKFELIR